MSNEEQREREMEAAWQEHDLLERRRQLEDIVLRARYSRTTDRDADILTQELGLSSEPAQPRDY